MFVTDENMDDEALLAFLREWRIHVRRIGREVGRSGMTDEDVIPLLHELGSVTFFTRDVDYYKAHLCHARYCLVYLDVVTRLLPEMIREFLRHPEFRTWAKRSGKVVRVGPGGLRFWSVKAKKAESLDWPDK